MTPLDFPAFQEAIIVINGHALNTAQSMTVRVALNSFISDLSDPEQSEALGEIGQLYSLRAGEVLSLIHEVKS